MRLLQELLEEAKEEFDRSEVDYKGSDYKLGYKHGRNDTAVSLMDLDDDGVDFNDYEAGRYDGWHNLLPGGKKRKKSK